MNRTYENSIVFAFLFALAVVFATLYFNAIAQKPGSATPGSRASIATTSQPTVTTSASLLFASTTSCTARVITTYAQPVMLTFSDNQGKVPTALFGHLQSASTTATYDSGQYGCDAVRAYAFASTNITISEVR